MNTKKKKKREVRVARRLLERRQRLRDLRKKARIEEEKNQVLLKRLGPINV
jgi:hypothetical protein